MGGFLASIIGPEAGAAAGQAMMETTDMVVPFLTERANGRIKALSTQANAEVQRRADGGGTYRSDGLLDDEELGQDILEGVFRGAIEAERNQKTAALANLAATIGFEDELSGADALRYIRLLRSASWRQLCALAYFADESFSAERERIAVKGSEGEAQIKPVLEAELSEMARSLELIGIRDTTSGAVNNPSNVFGGGQITAANLGTVAPTGLGLTLLRVTRLRELVEDDDLRELREDLEI